MIKVHQMRGGAPDKINLAHSDKIELLKHDNTNLVDYSFDELLGIKLRGEYILPADEYDIKHANQFLNEFPEDQSFILLPQVKVGNIYEVINYDQFVPKNSSVYAKLTESTGIKYMPYEEYDIDEFFCEFDSVRLNSEFSYSNGLGIAIKSTTGSGSRGVILIDPDRVHLGGKYVDRITDAELEKFEKFVRKEDCDIMLQQLIPFKDELKKINVDFVIRDGELLTYKWDIVNQSQQFTNWDNLHIFRNEYTDEVMSKLADYLTSKCGICNAIMNFEAFSDMESETILVEFNWRYSNSMFEWQAFNFDPIMAYFLEYKWMYDYGSYKASRYWQCKLYEDISGYHDGK